MKAVILAGGFGTRLSEYTESIPKPMVTIGGKPMLLHIMDHYAKFGITDFVIAAGYKSEEVKRFFLNFAQTSADFQIDTHTGEIRRFNNDIARRWNVTVVDTGLESMTGGRLLRLSSILQDQTFLLTYGDGLSDVDINATIAEHRRNGAMLTVTAVRPSARFGELEIESGKVTAFKEKPRLAQGWINGGFFVAEPSIFQHIKDDSSVLEKEPLETIASMGQLYAHQHEGFWQCMDTKRDRDFLENLWAKKSAPWA